MFDIDHPANATTLVLVAELEAAETDQEREERKQISFGELTEEHAYRQDDDTAPGLAN